MLTMKNLPLFLMCVVAFSACGGDDIQVYRIAKGEAGPVARAPAATEPDFAPKMGEGQMPEGHPPIGGGAGAGMGGMQAPPKSSEPVPVDGVPGMGWKIPKGWTGEGAAGMRLATFRYAGTETTVIALSGTAGGDLANANRWRGQIGLPPLGEAEFEKTSEFVQSGVGRVRVLDYKGAGKSLLGGFVLVDGQTWFFKMVGSAEGTKKAKPGFLELLKSLKPKA